MLKKIVLTALSLSIATALYAKTPEVVTTIKPLHSLTAQIMQGVGEPQLIITAGSPHGYHLKPSDVQAMNKADLLIWVSNDLETFMPESAEKIAQVQTITWDKLPDVKLLETRHGGLWEEAHNHDHEHAHEHEHDHAQEHGHEDHEHHDHEHEHHHHGKYNAHLWLGTENAAPLLRTVAQKLSELDPEHAAQYQENLQKSLQELQETKQAIEQTFSGVEKKSYMSFHDAYPYFEQEFGLNPVGVVRATPEQEPGIKRIEALRAVLQDNKVACLFNEPQFSSKLSEKLIANSNVKLGILDPLGADIPAGPEMYQKLQLELAKSFKKCFE